MASLKGADRSAIENAAHHSMVKAEKIIQAEKSSTDLPPALKGKVDRYVYMWRQQSDGKWPLYPRVLGETNPPSLGERLWDKMRYQWLKLSYHSTPVLYSFVPLRLWKIYRKLRGRPYAGELDYRLCAKTNSPVDS
jgi:hypothetical protein